MISRLIVLTLLVLFSFLGGHPVSADSLVIPGTGDSQELLRALAADFSSRTGHFVVIPDSIGSSGGIRQVLAGKAVMARVARRLRPREQQIGLVWQPFARSPVVFAVRKDGPGVTNLTAGQINQIFAGKIHNWQDLGGPNAPIYVAQREKGDSSRTILEAYFPVFRKGELAGEVLLSTPAMAQTLARYPGTIGYLPLSATIGHPLRPIAVNGQTPNQPGAYPYAVPLALVWKQKPKGAAADFVRYLFSPDARALIRAKGAWPAGDLP